MRNICSTVLLICSIIPLGATYSWTCSLVNSPVVHIQTQPSQLNISEEGGLFSEDDGDERRRLGTYDSALRQYHLNATISKNITDAIESRECTCTLGMLDTEDKFYCPSPTDHCKIWKRRYGSDYSVSCYKGMAWTVDFARQTWYYLCFIWILLLLYPIVARPGHHAVRYLLSKCFPRMNTWITDHLLRTEEENRSSIINDFAAAERRTRQTEGLVTGYRIKTKRYSSVGESKVDESEDVECNINAMNNDAENNTASNQGDPTTEAPQDDQTSNFDDINMCTICLLAVEDNELVADLSCGHLYHAECLGEWILKKNSCPLCQDSDIAKEIRSFEESENDERNEENPGNMFSRWSREARDSMLDVATGRRRRRGHHLGHHHINQYDW